MQPLPIAISQSELAGETVNAVDARELWAFLGVRKDFTSWMKDRITKYAFVEKMDFTVFTNSGENPLGGRPASTYVVSLEMAKELAMVENNDKGREARRYFIECEKKAKAAPVDLMQSLSDPNALRAMLLGYTEKVIALENTVAEQAPKVDALERLTFADGAVCITDASKMLGVRPKDLFAWMHSNKWIFRRHGKEPWLAYADKQQAGLLDVKTITVSRSDGSEKIAERTLVTAKGLTVLAEHTKSIRMAS